MDFIRNFPFFSIMLSMFAGIVSSVLPARAAKWVNRVVITVVGVLSLILLGYLLDTGESYVYMMGHFPAPWGNEIRAGVLEAGMALFFCIIMLLSMLGGAHKLLEEVAEEKQNLYYILVNLLLSSLLALVYTNDIFTAYVFVEINTITACGLIMIRETGRTIEAAVRYMIMSLLGSGLLLLGLCVLYDLTGHLLMSNMREQVAYLVAGNRYAMPLLVTIGLISLGLAIKSALFPFHAWLPDAYGYSTASSAAMLSSLVSKGYIFLLIKLIYRVFGFEVFRDSHIINVLFVFGLMGMIFGSISAIRENDIKRMVAFSSVAQIGYIYMGIGLATQEGMVASI
ncbi:MAG: sodium:proton antiporter, partial [Lachnospiraceae bacterium]|nr:sodium:proton antiporter [Lachnospiraceae bacterium]